MAEMTVEKLHAVIGALYATVAVHEQTIAELRAELEAAKKQQPSLLE